MNSDEITIEYSKKLQNLFFSSIFKKQVYLEPSQTSNIETYVKIVNNLMPLTIFTKSSILDI